jgi:hypothetical protein
MFVRIRVFGHTQRQPVHVDIQDLSMTEHDGWAELAEFLDQMYLKSIRYEFDRIHIEMHDFGLFFINKYPHQEKYLHMRYLDLYRFIFSEKSFSDDKLMKIHKKYKKVGYDNLEREFEVAIFYVKHCDKYEDFYIRQLIKLIASNFYSKELQEKINIIPEFYKFVRDQELYKTANTEQQ